MWTSEARRTKGLTVLSCSQPNFGSEPDMEPFVCVGKPSVADGYLIMAMPKTGSTTSPQNAAFEGVISVVALGDRPARRRGYMSSRRR